MWLNNIEINCMYNGEWVNYILDCYQDIGTVVYTHEFTHILMKSCTTVYFTTPFFVNSNIYPCIPARSQIAFTQPCILPMQTWHLFIHGLVHFIQHFPNYIAYSLLFSFHIALKGICLRIKLIVWLRRKSHRNNPLHCWSLAKGFLAIWIMSCSYTLEGNCIMMTKSSDWPSSPSESVLWVCGLQWSSLLSIDDSNTRSTSLLLSFHTISRLPIHLVGAR